MRASAPAPASNSKDFRVLITRPDSPATIPVWIRPYAPQKVTGAGVGRLPELPDLTVVQAKGPSAVLKRRGFLRSLAGKHAQSPAGSKILFVFQATTGTPDAKKLLDVLRFFGRPSDLEFARGAEQAAFACAEALAKVLASRLRSGQVSPGSDPLGELSSVITATAPLRSESGRLSAQRVADLFGLSVAELARLLGRSRQAVSKTDDARSLQEGLASFARVARLRVVLSEEDFRAWLNLPNEQLDGRSPLALIHDGAVEVVADLAEDMLAGSPS